MSKRVPSILKSPRISSQRPRVATGVYSSWPADVYSARRPPTKNQLVLAYRAISYAAANMNASAVASVPLRLYATTSGGQKAPRCPTKGVSRKNLERLEREPNHRKRFAQAHQVVEVTDHPVLDLLHNPNFATDSYSLIELTQLYLEVVGESFWVLVQGALNRPSEIWPLPSWLVTVLPDYSGDAGDGVIGQFLYSGGGGQIAYSPEQVLYFKATSLIDPYAQGYSPLRAAYQHAMIFDKLSDYEESVLTNRGRYDLIVSPKEEGVTGDDAQMRRFHSEFRNKFSQGQQGGVLFAPGGLNFTPMSWSPKDVGELETAKQAMANVARCFDIPVPLLAGDSTNRANLDGALLQYARFGLKKRVRRIEEHLNRHLVNRFDERLFVAFDEVVPADRAADREDRKTYISLGVVTRNEVRAEMGLEPDPEGDELLIPSNLVPIGRAGQFPDPQVIQPIAGPEPDEIPTAEADDQPFAERDDIHNETAPTEG